MSSVAEENPVILFDLFNDDASETRKTNHMVQELHQNTVAPNQPHTKADFLPLLSHHIHRCFQLVTKQKSGHTRRIWFYFFIKKKKNLLMYLQSRIRHFPSLAAMSGLPLGGNLALLQLGVWLLFRTWFSRHGDDGLMVGLDLGGLFQP